MDELCWKCEIMLIRGGENDRLHDLMFNAGDMKSEKRRSQYKKQDS